MPNRQKQTELARKVEFVVTARKIKSINIRRLRFFYFQYDTTKERFLFDF
ncbi:hypothetical protein HNW13_014150 [Shewanella sp. BF02_Schw]|nr:hypothetical protein [Shewanella sp. BF02_Schw]MBO1896901.1 hypothetical protein [Shewanella sp. BF02_Schw]